jgi:hypothetical protein
MITTVNTLNTIILSGWPVFFKVVLKVFWTNSYFDVSVNEHTALQTPARRNF